MSSLNGLINHDTNNTTEVKQLETSYPSPPLTAEASPVAEAAAVPMQLDAPPVVSLSELPAKEFQLAPTSLMSHDQSDASLFSQPVESPAVSTQVPTPMDLPPIVAMEEPTQEPQQPVEEVPTITEPEPITAEPTAAPPVSSLQLNLPVEPQQDGALTASMIQEQSEPSPLLDTPLPIPTPVQDSPLPASPLPSAENVLSPSTKRPNEEEEEFQRAAKRPKQETVLAFQPLASAPLSTPAVEEPATAAPQTSTTLDYPYSAQPYPVPQQFQAQDLPSPVQSFSAQTSAAATPSLDTTAAFDSPTTAYVAPTDYHPPPPSLPPIAFSDPTAPFVQRPHVDMSRSPIPLPKEQQKYANSIIKALKKSKDAAPFTAPVDPVYLGLPQYYAIVTEPMDLMTLEKKLHQHCYGQIEEFIADARRIFANCYRFNGETAPVSLMGKSLEAQLEKMLLKMPSAHPSQIVHPKSGSPSTARPKGRKDSYGGDRPKREIHAPSPYDALDDYTIAAPPKKKRPAYGHSGEDTRFCKEVWRELTKKSNAHFNWVFLEPVDYVKLNLPDYPKIVKRPMDLGTMKRKLDNGEYPNADAFHRDFKLLISNCYAYNPPGTDVHRMGQQLDAIFEAKWLEKPDPYSDYGSGSESDEQITMMERQLEMMRQNLISMKAQKQRRKDEKREQQNAAKREAAAAARRAAEAAAAAAIAARPPPTPRPPPNGAPAGPKPVKPPRRSSTTSAPKPKRSGRMSSDDEFVGFQEVTFQMKSDLATGIGNFEGEQLQKAIDIIRKSRPDLLGDESKEIELDIDQLDANTLLKLYNYVVGPPKKQRVKQETLTASGQRAQKGGRAGTGGLKGKSLDENEETARIRALEEQLKRFDGAPSAMDGSPNGPSMPTNKADATGMTSSDDDSEESDSDSE